MPAEEKFDIQSLGQVFTPEPVVNAMLTLRQHNGNVLEPACGNGMFLRHLGNNAVGIELDPQHCPENASCQDFFAYPEEQKFDTIIGNPPYVRFQDIRPDTRELLNLDLFDRRSNLYLFFIEKCVKHLKPHGELIFITPRDFLKSTSSVRLNQWLCAQGTLTHALELGDVRLFSRALPNCLIWRFEKGLFHRVMHYTAIGAGHSMEDLLRPQWQQRILVECAGHLMFCRRNYPLRMSDIATVRVGAVSGADDIYCSERWGNRDFVYAATERTGQTRRMIWCDETAAPPPALQPSYERLIQRKIRAFNANNWWCWGRGYTLTTAPRVYVNGRTRHATPFFIHPCQHYDGSVLAIFPHRQDIPLQSLRDCLNTVDWDDLGFVCDGRKLFTQRSLENAPLPETLRTFMPKQN